MCPQPAQDLIRAELATREFMPVIERIVSVTSYSTPCTWTVETDRGTMRVRRCAVMKTFAVSAKTTPC